MIPNTFTTSQASSTPPPSGDGSKLTLQNLKQVFDSIETVNSSDLDEVLGGGTISTVYALKITDSYVVKIDHIAIKRFNPVTEQEQEFPLRQREESEFQVEATDFNKIYGETGCKVITYNGRPALLLLKLKGIRLDNLQQKDAPDNLTELVEEAFARLESVGLLHDDIDMSNFIYDPNEMRLNPIDFSQPVDPAISGGRHDMDARYRAHKKEFLSLITQKFYSN